MGRFQITCATVSATDTTHTGIIALGGPGWVLSKEQMVERIRSGQDQFFTQDAWGHQAEVFVVDERHGWIGKPYVMTTPDESSANNLLNLGACSISSY